MIEIVIEIGMIYRVLMDTVNNTESNNDNDEGEFIYWWFWETQKSTMQIE